MVYPKGVDRGWGADPLLDRENSDGQVIDDVGFLVALIDHINSTLPLDLDRVFVTGNSNGGAMSYTMACHRPDRIAAIAPVTMQLAAEGDCSGAEPTPILIINGTDDPVVPYDGGHIEVFDVQREAVTSTEDTVTFWRELNGCGDKPITSTVDERAFDGTSATMTIYNECASEAVVTLIAVDGGGHTWPGGFELLPESLVGRTSREFNAPDVIWAFFAAQ